MQFLSLLTLAISLGTVFGSPALGPTSGAASQAKNKASKSTRIIASGDGGGQGEAVAADDFVRVEGTRFVTKKGTHYLTGINYWACMNLAADDSAGGNRTRFEIEMDQMAAKGINHLRIMAASEGSPTPQPFRMLPALQPAPGVWNEDIFVGLDRCIAEMAKRGMRATMTVANEWQWSGGFAQYVSWTHDNETISYPPSWNLTAPPQRDDGHPGYGNYTTTGSFNDYTAYANQFYNDTAAQKVFQNHMLKVMNRKNTVSGRVYKNDPTIMTWEVANEPQPAPQNVSGLELAPNPNDTLFPWLKETAAFIKKNAPKQLCTSGFEGKQGEWYWKKVHDIPEIDYGCTHLWVQNWNKYDMLNESAANLLNAIDYARVFIANSSQWAMDLGKPVLLEEFGMARDNWENNVPAGEYQYASKASIRNKDEYFQYIFSTVVSYFWQGKAYAGTAPWAYGGIYRPENQTLSSEGILWAGDPQHEAPGWYDLYSDDSTMDLLHWQQKNVSMLLDDGSN